MSWFLGVYLLHVLLGLGPLPSLPYGQVLTPPLVITGLEVAFKRGFLALLYGKGAFIGPLLKSFEQSGIINSFRSSEPEPEVQRFVKVFAPTERSRLGLHRLRVTPASRARTRVALHSAQPVPARPNRSHSMRGSTARQTTMLTVADPGDLIPGQHPIRRIRPFVEAALAQLEPTFEVMYAKVGRPSIPPEQLLKATVLMALSRFAPSVSFASSSSTTCSSSGS